MRNPLAQLLTNSHKSHVKLSLTFSASFSFLAFVLLLACSADALVPASYESTSSAETLSLDARSQTSSKGLGTPATAASPAA